MTNRVVVILLLLALALPAAAQDSPLTAADWIPADFAGFIRLDMRQANETLNTLRIAAALAAELQPARVRLPQDITYDTFFPLAAALDAEGLTFATLLPWLGDELALAYRRFDGSLRASADDILLILPTDDIFAAASRLRPALEAQDLLQTRQIGGITVYEGDRLALAFAPTAVLVGPSALIEAALDSGSGAADRLTGTAAYQAVRAASPADEVLFAYAAGDAVAASLTGIISGQADVQPLLAALGGALETAPPSGFNRLLFGGGFDGAGVSFALDRSTATFSARIIFHTASPVAVSATPAFDDALLTLLPRSAMLAQTGGDFRALAYDALAALPLSNFSGQIIGGLPFVTAGSSSPLVTPPDGETMRGALVGARAALAEFGDVDLDADVLDRLNGAYALALLPRPENRLRALNTPFDVLLAVRPDDGEAALAGFSRLLQTVFDLEPAAPVTFRGVSFTALAAAPGGEPVFTLGVMDDGTLLVGTGRAAEAALIARQGDNRLTDLGAWTALAAPGRPDFYVDTAAFFNTFFPQPGGATPGLDQRVRLAVWTRQLESRLYEMRVTALLPQRR